MILGIGCDFVEIGRIQSTWARQGEEFARRVLSAAEWEISSLYEPRRLVEFLAGRFAAKEAMAKAAGCGLGRLGMNRVTLRVQASGLAVIWDGSADPAWPTDTHWHISISHSAAMAMGMAVLERIDGAKE